MNLQDLSDKEIAQRALQMNSDGDEQRLFIEEAMRRGVYDNQSAWDAHKKECDKAGLVFKPR